MENFKTRLEAEHTDVSEKVQKLMDFIYSSKFEAVEDAQKGLLKIQLRAMTAYKQVLWGRLSLLK